MNSFKETLTYIRHLPRAFWAVIGATLLNQAGNMAFVFLVLYATKHLGFGLTQASSTFAAFATSMLITSLGAGNLIDKIGSARMMIGALVINGITLLSFPFVHDYPTIIVMCLIWGFAYGLYRPASQTLVSHLSTPGLHKITFSLYRLVINLGMSIGPAIGGYLALHSFASIFLVNGIANFLAGLALLLGLASTTWFSYRPTRHQKMEFSLKWLTLDKNLGLFVLGLLPATMVFYQHESTLPVFLNTGLHLSLSFYGLLFTINTLIIVFCELPLNVLTLNWPYRVNFILGSLINACSFAALCFATKEWHVILVAIGWTIGEMILFPAAGSYIADIAPESQRGTYMSIYTSTTTLGLLLGPWAGAFIMEYIGASGLWIACGWFGMLSVLIFLKLREPVSNLTPVNEPS